MIFVVMINRIVPENRCDEIFVNNVVEDKYIAALDTDNSNIYMLRKINNEYKYICINTFVNTSVIDTYLSFESAVRSYSTMSFIKLYQFDTFEEFLEWCMKENI